MLVSITAPSINERGPQFMEKVFASVLDSIGPDDVLQLEYGHHEEAIGIFCRFPEHLQQHVLAHFNAKYPNCTITTLADDACDPSPAHTTWSCSLSLVPELFPILRHKQFQDMLTGSLEDPLESLLAVVQTGDGLTPRIRITLRPVRRFRRLWARGAVKRLDRPFFRSHHILADFYARTITSRWLWFPAFLLGMLSIPGRFSSSQADTTSSRFGDREDDVQAAADKIGGKIFDSRLELFVTGPRDLESLARTRLRTIKGAFGSFTRSRLATFRSSRIHRGVPRKSPSFLLSHEELATLFHPATGSVGTERLAVTPFTELGAPARLATGDESGGVVLGQVKHKDDQRRFGIREDERRRHLYCVGRTGVGKSTILQNLIRSDIAAGRGVCLIDPHGDLAETIIASIPTHRTNDCVVFDPSDREHAIAFNPLACRDGWEDRVTSGVVTSFKKIYDSWGPRLEDTLRNTTYLAVEHGGTLFDVLRLLTDDAERNRLLAQGTSDDLSYRFWTTEFARWNDRYRTEAVAAILNKVRPFLMNKNVRAVVSQPGRGLDLRQVMDEGKILIANLSKGQLGEDNANLLGALLVSSIQQAAMSRADIPEDDRRDFYLYIDEFQNFSTGSFADILSEARKYRLSMTIAHQYTRQLDEATADAVFGNVGSMVVFQVGSEDADILSRQLRKFPDQIAPEDLTNIPKYHAYVRLLQEGMPEHPFSMETLPPEPIGDDRSALVRHVSNQQHARNKDQVLAWLVDQSPNAPNGLFVPQTQGSQGQVLGSISLR